MSHDPTSTSGISRRTFLTAGGALLGSAVLLQPNAAPPNALAALAKRNGARVSVGYIANSAGATAAELASLLADGGARVTPATAIRSGGASFRDGFAKVHLQGAARGLGPSTMLRGAQLDALVHPKGAPADTPVPFFAWTMNGQGAAGSDVAFVVPFERQPTLGLNLRTRKDDTAPWTDSVAVFTGGADRNMAKLREGAYLVGLAPKTWDKAGTLPPADDARWGGMASLLLSVHPA